jgi:hypothetical protein
VRFGVGSSEVQALLGSSEVVMFGVCSSEISGRMQTLLL